MTADSPLSRDVSSHGSAGPSATPPAQRRSSFPGETDAVVTNSNVDRPYWAAEHATIIHADHATATITAYCTGVESARYWAVRLVRQAMTAQLLTVGAVYAHAAAFSHRGRGVLTTGHKGAGKTTTLVTSLRLLGCDYVTNDRLLLRREGGELIGRPWPMHIRVGVGTLLTLRAAPTPTSLILFSASPPEAAHTCQF